jgi:hypothetical protein
MLSPFDVRDAGLYEVEEDDEVPGRYACSPRIYFWWVR